MKHQNLNIVCLKNKIADIAKLQKIIATIFEDYNILEDKQLNIVIADDKYLRDLNKRFRKIDQTTDVLTFYLEEEAESKPVLGDIYISAEKARSQAAEYEVSVQTEIERLMIHGILHLLGYEHEKKSDQKVMEQKTEEYLNYSKEQL